MELLERHFEIVLETSDGIMKLRELILSLAMQGKLVQQDPNDQPANELIKKIDAEKKIQLKEGKIKEQELFLSIAPEEIPYELPKGWEWVFLGNVISVKSSKRIFESDYCSDGIPFYRSKEIGELSRTGKCDDRFYISREKYNEIRNQFGIPQKGDILLTSVGSIGGCWIVDDREFYYKDGNVTQLEKCTFILSNYLYLFINSPLFTVQVEKAVSGTAYKALTIVKIKSLKFPLPPLDEQKRIVAKANHLMTLCDKLEIERNERNQKRLTIHAAAINKLLSSSNEIEFNTSWGFITKNFNELYSVQENVEELKKTILQLAVMGKLVPQDPNEQPANELLKEIAVEKEKLIKEGKVKNQELLLPIKSEEIPFEVPNGWEWTQLCNLGEINPRNYVDDDLTAAFIPMPLIYAEYGKIHGFEEKSWNEIKKGFTHFAEGDVVLAKITPCFENGKSCVMRDLPNKVGAGTTELHVFRNIYNKICPEYILIFLKSPWFISNGIPKMTGSAGQKRVPKNYFACAPFPLPPITEQRRIVCKVDQLIELCNIYEQQIKDLSMKQSLIRDVILKEV